MQEKDSTILLYNVGKKCCDLDCFPHPEEIFNYCNKERIDNNESYFKEIEIMLKKFCEENGIYRLAFYTYCPHSSVFENQ